MASVKTVAVCTDDAHLGARVREALERLDVVLVERPREAAIRAEQAQDAALVVADAGHDARDVVAAAERHAAADEPVPLLLIVEPDAVSSLRLPVGVPSDFVVRSAQPAEIAARARLLLWPGEEAGDSSVVRVGELTLNLATYQAHVSGVPVEFAYMEYALFAFLVTHPNRVYSREALLRRVWGHDYFGGARTVDVHVRRIRAKLGPELAARLETVRNVGYLWRM
ncbi:MAG: response regulator transcription factor [Coriobacteriia bacterium]|nr:response regulator transcription factor [Coriobacteriia bacterium]